MAFSTSSPFGGFSFPANVTSKITSNTLTSPSMDVDMESQPLFTETDAANDILGSRPDGYQESLETGIEYRKFARALERLQSYRQGTKKDLDIASVLPEFDAVCFTRAQQAERRMESDAGYAATGDADEYQLWQSEHNTWLLLSTLFRRPVVDKGPDALEWSDLDLVEHLTNTDSDFKHHRAVKVWLEVIAPHISPLITPKNHKPAPKAQMSFSFSAPADSSAPKYQDPDAPTRDGVRFSDHNQRAEHDLLRAVWQYIRRGQHQQARKACISAGEHWRAESISGGAPYAVSIAFTDPAYDRDEGLSGNKTRGLWKGTCYALAKEKSADQFERAVYGALCGDVESVIPVCSTWEDHAWARYNALVERMVEERLSQFNRGAPTKALPLPNVTITSAKDIFDSLANSEDKNLSHASKDIFRAIQISIILGRTDELLSKMAKEARASTKSGSPPRPHMLRFMTHFVLLLRSKGVSVPKADGDYFIKAFVDYLISRKMYDLAPLYASFLPAHLQIESCSAYLKTIDGPKKEREEHLMTIRKHGLDLHRILMATVDALLDKSRADFEKDGDYQENLRRSITASITSQERAHIKALEWLTFDTPQYEECLHRSNYLTRKYLAQGRLNAAYTLYKSLPGNIIQHEIHELAPMAQSIAHEHLYYKDLFAARDAFEKWKEAMESDLNNGAAQSVEARENTIKEKAQEAITEIESLLRSRWLFDCTLPGDMVRNQELKAIRQIYVSELVMNLHQVYFEMRGLIPEYLNNSVEMANMVASEASGAPLYSELSAMKRLQEFLRLVRLSSIELIKQEQNPFAY
ncbi:Nucleoporin nup84 [Mortierella alpina]|uniref:Nuclear pore complex protein n=1 Tax=Mortierella alpina TaxID=64518 RepID=A0A9P6M604_MORAP|nr:Nucleoporin nup84 [Mortierella alpina]